MGRISGELVGELVRFPEVDGGREVGRKRGEWGRRREKEGDVC